MHTMALMQLRRAGMGALGDNSLPPSYSGTYNPAALVFPPNYGAINVGLTPPSFPSSGGNNNSPSNTALITGTIAAGLNLVGTWLTTHNRLTGAQTSLVYNPQTRQYYDRSTGQYYNATEGGPNNTGVTTTSNGLNIFGTNVSFGTLIVLIGGFALLQHRGFEKRR